eukprot:gnl/TRDRNA2_/TRDRNA2_180299_c0_seq1.p1 gnl/TRDRNA2_/TRDRNA2_180299_c0~~gnl/TRDRNA2_/TRDRNA2_180299_c0_seq1.p1  ORF type:complete len:254 (+),score=98.48 gnl/TRDRNA2_/TRDRNA2_180299_c0_seq1:108-869(+)
MQLFVLIVALTVATAAVAAERKGHAQLRRSKADSLHKLTSGMDAMFQAEREIMMDSADPEKKKLEEKLAGLIFMEDMLRKEQKSLEDDEYKKKIDEDKKKVANETSEGVAEMLSNMRLEMHMFSVPFYKKVLAEKLEENQQQQKEINAKLERMEDSDEAEQESTQQAAKSSSKTWQSQQTEAEEAEQKAEQAMEDASDAMEEAADAAAGPLGVKGNGNRTIVATIVVVACVAAIGGIVGFLWWKNKSEAPQAA